MAKILIEFYSGKMPENLISILKEHCDRVYFFYFKKKNPPSEKMRTTLREVMSALLGFEPSFHGIRNFSVEGALAEFEKIYSEKNEYLIDLTGGDELLIAAAGIFAERFQAGVSLHQYDIPTGKQIFRFPETKSREELFPRYLSVPQALTLNGSAPLSAPAYSFTRGALQTEILRLWEAVRRHLKEWNRFGSLPAIEEDKKNIEQKVAENPATLHAYYVISTALKGAGILKDETLTRKGGRTVAEFVLDVDEDARFLYEKAGNLLEMYCALCAYESGIFHDIRVGVHVDWNGKASPCTVPDPRNEIDLILMHENLPVLISCKNTEPENEHLYEIMIMAKHYGGHYATPALFTTGKASPTVKERAKEMGIVLVDSIRLRSKEELTSLFIKHFNR